MAEITIKGVEGNPLNINVVMNEILHHLSDGVMETETVDFYPDTTKPVRAYLDSVTARRQYCPSVAVSGNTVYLSANNVTAGVYTLTIICTDTNGKARRFKSEPCIEIYDITRAAEVAEEFDSEQYTINGVFYTFMTQADWAEENPVSPAYIWHKPDLSVYATDEELQAVEDEIPNVPEWAMQPQKPTYTAAEVGAVPTTRKVNGKALSQDITLSPADVGAASIAQLNEEQAAREQAITALSGDLANEQTARQQADNTLQGNIGAEKVERQQADATLQGNIDTERLARQQADTQIQLSVIAERTARENADASLQSAINTERAAREQAVDGLQANITAEQQRAQAAEQQNASDIDVIEGKIPAEASTSNKLADKAYVDAEVGELSQEVEQGYAKKDGAYEQLLAGSAMNLVDTSGTSSLREFVFSPSGGGEDIATGSALIKRMRGNTIVWNQLAKALNNNDWGSTGTLTVTYTNHVARATTNIDNAESWQNRFLQREYTNNIQGHKLLVAATVTPSVSCNVSVWTYGKDAEGITSGYSSYYRYENLSANVKKRVSAIFDMSQKAAVISCYPAVSFYGNALPANSYMDIQDFVFFDLTKMFGAGNEPSTVEEFEALFPLDYYDYNEGSLLSFSGDSIKTVGFNQWDEQWELGRINVTTGEKEAYPTRIRSKNYIPVLGGISYYFKSPKYLEIFCYDSNKNYIKYLNSDVPNYSKSIPSDCAFILFVLYSDYGTTYNNDICINLSWNGSKNGTYEPYESHTKDISFYKSIKDSQNNTLFPYGLLSAGNVYDEVTATKATKRIGRQLVTGAIGNTITLVGCSTTATTYKCASDIGTLSSGVLTLTVAVTDAEVLFELATPIEVEYAEQNMAYLVNDWGTEQLLPENTNVPTTTPAMLDVTYGINAVDTIKNLPRNYLAQGDLDRLLSAMGNALGFTYTKTWNEADGQWSYTITKTTEG